MTDKELKYPQFELPNTSTVLISGKEISIDKMLAGPKSFISRVTTGSDAFTGLKEALIDVKSAVKAHENKYPVQNDDLDSVKRTNLASLENIKKVRGYKAHIPYSDQQTKKYFANMNSTIEHMVDKANDMGKRSSPAEGSDMHGSLKDIQQLANAAGEELFKLMKSMSKDTPRSL